MLRFIFIVWLISRLRRLWWYRRTFMGPFFWGGPHHHGYGPHGPDGLHWF